jgi:hypothetical protein
VVVVVVVDIFFTVSNSIRAQALMLLRIGLHQFRLAGIRKLPE